MDSLFSRLLSGHEAQVFVVNLTGTTALMFCAVVTMTMAMAMISEPSPVYLVYLGWEEE